MVKRSNGRAAARRPSRRDNIVRAAVTVFARQGFQGGSVQDIAAEASVVPTSVYYHFSSKEDLYDAALERVLGEIDAVVEQTRPTGQGDASALVQVLGAVWDWVEENPEPARLLYHQLPGATPRALLLRREFEERHIARAVDYFPPDTKPVSKREAAARWAVTSLAMRSIVALGMSTHSLRMGDGPLANQSVKALRKAYLDVSELVIVAAAPE